MPDEIKDGKVELPPFDERKVDWGKCPNLYNVSEVRARRLWGQKEQRECELRAALSALEGARNELSICAEKNRRLVENNEKLQALVDEACTAGENSESEVQRLLLNQEKAREILKRKGRSIYVDQQQSGVIEAISLLERNSHV